MHLRSMMVVLRLHCEDAKDCTESFTETKGSRHLHITCAIHLNSYRVGTFEACRVKVLHLLTLFTTIIGQ